MTRLAASSRAYDEAFDPDTVEQLSIADQRALDRVLIGTERVLTRADGLPGRPWFKHQIYAPGFYTGYGVKTIPGVREAVEQRDWPLATTQIGLAAETLTRFADQIDRATDILGGSR
jgi:N-acetylated-alpha-linked acidic dipeptidase